MTSRKKGNGELPLPHVPKAEEPDADDFHRLLRDIEEKPLDVARIPGSRAEGRAIITPEEGTTVVNDDSRGDGRTLVPSVEDLAQLEQIDVAVRRVEAKRDARTAAIKHPQELDEYDFEAGSDEEAYEQLQDEVEPETETTEFGIGKDPSSIDESDIYLGPVVSDDEERALLGGGTKEDWMDSSVRAMELEARRRMQPENRGRVLESMMNRTTALNRYRRTRFYIIYICEHYF